MSPKKLFLSHYSLQSKEVAQLATELRLRGVTPWVDKDGGFAVGDHSATEATRAITEDCLGFLLYASKEAFERPFIVDVEFPAALAAKSADESFLLFAVPRGISFGELQQLSSAVLGFDLSPYHSVGLPFDAAFEDGLRKLARDVLSKVLQHIGLMPAHPLPLQVSTRDLMPPEVGEALCVDATGLFRAGVNDEAAWSRLLSGLSDVKHEVATRWGRPRLRIDGSKHLTAAFMIGRVFSPMEMDIRQTREAYWQTDATPGDDVLRSQLVLTDGDPIMTVEVAGRFKAIADGVADYSRRTGLAPSGRLQLGPIETPLDIDNASCRAMARQTYEEIEKAVAKLRGVEEIHLFVAAPQAFMMMLGREFKGMPKTVHYEWTGDVYERSCAIAGGVL